MADIELKYLTELLAATSVADDDLLHVNQSGNDKSISFGVIKSAIVNVLYPVSTVHWFADNSNPNNIWPGTVWARVPGSGRSIRLANESGSDVLQQSGSDSVALKLENTPSHNHSFSGNTTSFDYGTKTTNQGGDHTHRLQRASFDNTGDLTIRFGGGGAAGYTGNSVVENSGSHSHQVGIGAHSHYIEGFTALFGNGEPFSVANASIKLAAWHRVS
ncbi:phage baseplate protein [Serratia proteamaculans]|uniref:Baseplate structural protein Gp10 C-terminal domain-containing protein n=1 Tax=Serratia proteamaculans TaxID=28151 RepID=A0A5Q2VHP3_SERPR|nr:hypothetical protein [Serratia proteamaculans]QGH63445.1 hypothetical protein GHV41_22500 [Serratia proteamaculans]